MASAASRSSVRWRGIEGDRLAAGSPHRVEVGVERGPGRLLARCLLGAMQGDDDPGSVAHRPMIRARLLQSAA